jgi:micrococcal nuclease
MPGSRRFSRGRPIGRWRFAVLLVLAGIALYQFFFPAAENREPGSLPETAAVVVRAVDGDTLLLPDQVYVRLLGVDTPETKRPNWPVERFGPEAHEFTRSRVEGKTVRLEYDKERYDKYHRVLAYVYVGDSLLNEELIRSGMGRAITNHPYSESMKRRFRAAEAAARRERLGIWSRKD